VKARSRSRRGNSSRATTRRKAFWIVECGPFTGFVGCGSGPVGSDEGSTSRGVKISSYRSSGIDAVVPAERHRTSEDGTISVKAPPGVRQRANTATGQHADDRKVVAAPRRVEGSLRTKVRRRVARLEEPKHASRSNRPKLAGVNNSSD